MNAVNVQESLNPINSAISQKQSSIDSKFSQLQGISASLPFTVHFKHGALAAYSFVDAVSTETTVDKLFITVQFDVKATGDSADGLLWYLVTEASKSTSEMKHIQD